MPDSFHVYLKKQLLEYVENERKKGVPLEEIEKALLNAGHQKNIVDEIFAELKNQDGGKGEASKNPVENDILGMLKQGLGQFMAKSKESDVKEAITDMKKEDTKEIVKEVIEEAEVIEEKNFFEGIAFFIYLLGMGAVILFSSGATDSQIVNVALGFAPALINAFISFIALPIADNVPIFIFIPLGICSAFYALGRFAHISVFGSLDMEALSLVNFILAFIFNIMIVYIRFVKPNSMKRRLLRKKPLHNKTMPPASQEQRKPVDPEKRKNIDELKKEFNLS